MTAGPPPRRPVSKKREIIMDTIKSADGTTIAYDRSGSGEPLVLDADFETLRWFPLPHEIHP